MNPNHDPARQGSRPESASTVPAEAVALGESPNPTEQDVALQEVTAAQWQDDADRLAQRIKAAKTEFTMELLATKQERLRLEKEIDGLWTEAHRLKASISAFPEGEDSWKAAWAKLGRLLGEIASLCLRLGS